MTRWRNIYEPSNNYEPKAKHQVSSKENGHQGAFCVMQGILTPHGELINNQIIECGEISVGSFVPSYNCHFVD
jgi:hypothetical protein